MQINNKQISKWKESHKVQKNYIDSKLHDAILEPRFKNSWEKIIWTANQLLDNKFIFNGQWDMEQTHVLYDQGNPVDWNKMQKEDPEYLFMLNRHTTFLVLAKTYFYTKDDKYVKKIKDFFYSWLDSKYTSIGLESQVNRILDKGIRINNWTETLLLIINSKEANADFITDMLKEIKRHAESINNDYLSHHSLSNHGLIANWGLLKSQYYFGEIIDINYKNNLLKRIEENARLQILLDGMHWEQSPMYHNWSVMAFLEIKRYGKKLGLNFSQSFFNRIHRLCWASLKFIKPNNHQPMIGDSDDMLMSDILTRAFIELGDPEFKYKGLKKINLDILFEYGSKIIDKYENSKSHKPIFTSAFLNHSGSFFLRSSWDENANYLTFRNGQYGSGHGHADDNSLSVFANGEDWIINTGRYTYKENAERVKLKSAFYHNSQIINNEGATVPNSSWKYDKVALNIKQNYFSDNDIDYVSGYNLGFFNSPIPVIPNRKIIFIKPNIWFIYDTFYSNKKSEYKILYHVTKDTNIKNSINKLQLNKNNKTFNVWKMSDLKTNILKSQFSKHYNQIEDCNVISFSKEGNNISSIYSVLEVGQNIKNIKEVNVKRCTGDLISRNECRAFQINMSSTNSYVLVIANMENYSGKKLYEINNHTFYGKVVVLHFDQKILLWEKILDY